MCTHIKKCNPVMQSSFATPLPPNLHPSPTTDLTRAFGCRQTCYFNRAPK